MLFLQVMASPPCLWLWPAEVTASVPWCLETRRTPSSTAHLSLQTGVHKMSGLPSVCQAVNTALPVLCLCPNVSLFTIVTEPSPPCRSWLLHNPLPRSRRSVCRADLRVDRSPGVVQTEGLHAQHLGGSQAGWQEVAGLQHLKWLETSLSPVCSFRAPLSVNVFVYHENLLTVD